MPGMRNQLSLSPQGGKGAGPGDRERARPHPRQWRWTRWTGEGGGEGPKAPGNLLPFNQDDFFLLVKAKGSSPDREVALPPGTAFDSVVWVDPGAAWAFCSRLNSHVVRRMLGNYTIC